MRGNAVLETQIERSTVWVLSEYLAQNFNSHHDGPLAEPTGAGRDPRAAAALVVRASDVEPEAVEWLWPGRVPFGKVTLLEGDPGLGKSTIALDLAARLTLGNPMPDGSKPAMAGGVVVLSAEDGASDTIRPRLEAAGAALQWVGIVEGVAYPDGTEDLVTLPDHLEAVRGAIAAITARLVIVDPLAAYLGGGVNTHRDHHVRRALAPLHQLAGETGAAVLISRHLNKSLGGSAMYRGGGSIGIIGAARSALLAALDPDDAGSPEEERRRVLAVVKSNLCKRAPSLSYRMVEADNGAVRIEWLGQSQHRADALVAVPADDEERTAVEELREYLRGVLADGPRPAADLLRDALRQFGVTERTVRRARAALGVVVDREGFGPGSRVLWSLPKPIPDVPGGMSGVETPPTETPAITGDSHSGHTGQPHSGHGVVSTMTDPDEAARAAMREGA